MDHNADPPPSLLETLETIEDPEKRSKLHHAPSVDKAGCGSIL